MIFNKNQVYKERFFLYQYNNENIRIVCQKYGRKKGFEEIKRNNDYIEQFGSNSLSSSISRSRRMVRELALSNNFEYFCTLTVKSDNSRFHLDEVQEELRKIFKRIKRKNKDFIYLFITEKHKDGAFHFHGLIGGYDNFYTNDNGYLSSTDFDELGFQSFSKIKNYTKCCNYILKYITKDCVRNSAGSTYISSRGLKKADKYEISPISTFWGYENDFVKIRDLSLSQLSKEDILQFYNINEKELTFKNLFNKILLD